MNKSTDIKKKIREITAANPMLRFPWTWRVFRCTIEGVATTVVPRAIMKIKLIMSKQTLLMGLLLLLCPNFCSRNRVRVPKRSLTEFYLMTLGLLQWPHTVLFSLIKAQNIAKFLKNIHWFHNHIWYDFIFSKNHTVS